MGGCCWELLNCGEVFVLKIFRRVCIHEVVFIINCGCFFSGWNRGDERGELKMSFISF